MTISLVAAVFVAFGAFGYAVDSYLAIKSREPRAAFYNLTGFAACAVILGFYLKGN